MPDDSTTSITIFNDIKVTVPASNQYMTTFVLQEQGDWFEDEIHFIRHFIKPGMNVIDIGANHGLYTLSIAKIISDTGRIWAFEPTESTANSLRTSIEDNKFSNITLIQSGLSDTTGVVELYTSPNSELNSLSKEAVPGDKHESISIDTLDNCRHEYGWKNIDFIKLDAEGEEDNILKAGIDMLSEMSPLIMFELKHGGHINLPLISRFRSMGYSCYRLLPGLNVLMPFDPEETFDSYLLNLFCCKQDKAEQLEEQGVVVSNWFDIEATDDGIAKRYVSNLPYYRSIIEKNTQGPRDGSSVYMKMFNLYVQSLSESSSSQNRVSSLMSALNMVHIILMGKNLRIEWLAVAVRIAIDAGERALAVKILSELIKQQPFNQDLEVEELLLPALKRYEQIAPGGQIADWLWSSIYEQCIVKHAYSSYFTKHSALPLYEQLNARGFISEQMSQRYQLVASRFAGQA